LPARLQKKTLALAGRLTWPALADITDVSPDVVEDHAIPYQLTGGGLQMRLIGAQPIVLFGFLD